MRMLCAGLVGGCGGDWREERFVESALRATASGGRPRRGGKGVYTRSRHQSQNGRENIPAAGTNRTRGERIYP
eukprot:5315334-Pyramimonas_sp.AAC.1